MFAPENEYGVLDHEVVTPSGDTVYVPLRAIADGDACEVVLTLRRAPGMTDAEFERDTALVTRDLVLLKKVLEGAPPHDIPGSTGAGNRSTPSGAGWLVEGVKPPHGWIMADTADPGRAHCAGGGHGAGRMHRRR
jgi:hypothetical protein